MRGKLSIVAALLAASSGVALAATTDTPGVSGSQILIGGTAPLTGEASSAQAVSKGAEAYFKYVGAKVNGRSISYKVVDDAYDPPRTVQAVRQLVHGFRGLRLRDLAPVAVLLDEIGRIRALLGLSVLPQRPDRPHLQRKVTGGEQRSKYNSFSSCGRSGTARSALAW